MADESSRTDAPGSTAGARQTRKSARSKPKRENEKSSISFPYSDMESGITVARAILGAGGVALTRDQLAGVMNLAVGSGNFVNKIATARIFGLVGNVGGKYELTNLGFSIVDTDEKRQKAARAEAFLNVPLYKRAYDEFRGKQLPPRPHGLEQAFVKFGVASKTKNIARLIFDKSATQAGFFPNGPDRLIEPIVGATVMPRMQAVADVGDDDVTQSGAGTRASDTSGMPPFVQVLVNNLPEAGTNWAIEGRAKWLQAAAAMFELIYKGSGEIHIAAKLKDEQKND
jgi:hypothetical protein